MRVASLFWLLASGFFLFSCSRPPERSFDRIAILPFENLTGDSSFDWVSAAAQVIVGSEITGLPKVLPIRAQTVSDAYLSRANRFLHGYMTSRGGTLHFEVEVEDAARHRMAQMAAVDGGVLSAMDSVAKRLDPGARPFSTSNTGALEAWGRGDYERAVTLDPDFGAAWLGWLETLASKGERSEAISVAGRALSRPSLRSDVDRARIELLSASWRQDLEGRRNALRTLARLLPADSTQTQALAEIELSARNFSAAAELFKGLLRADPSNAAAMNSLGYAEVYAGNLDAARKVLEDYSRQPDQKTNALDSLGEAHFMNGQFKDAEKYFLQASESNPSFGGGTDLMKAAYARWLGGDLHGADALMLRHLKFRADLHDPLLAWREATWLYTTGRKDQAIAKLESAPASEKQLVERQLAVWRGSFNPPADIAELKERYQRESPASDGQARTFYAAALAAAGRKDEARKLLTLWPLFEGGGDPLFQSLVYPKFIELRREIP